MRLFLCALIVVCFLDFFICFQVNNSSLNLKHFETGLTNSTYYQKNNQLLSEWSEWSSWSKCHRCVQKRIKICQLPSCKNMKMYQERSCGKKRCRRKIRHEKEMSVFLPEKKNDRPFTKNGDNLIWSKWSGWSDCSSSCKTHRKRYCRNPYHCRKRRQIQNAYCYHSGTDCREFVLRMMESNKDRTKNSLKYNYGKSFKLKKKCGYPYPAWNMFKIIGGVESQRYKWPWHVAIINRYSEIFCGGTLIAPQWILTASHCIRPLLRVRLHEHDLERTDGSELELMVYRTFQNPNFNPSTVDSDIALLQLPIPVHTPYACLPDRKPIPREVCYVMGWGKTSSYDKDGSTVLRETQIPVVDELLCKWSYRDFKITPNMMCAGWASGLSDTCAGDSGGGLMCHMDYGGYTIQGITSFGKGCGQRNKYGIYTLVFNYLNWINYIINTYQIN